MRILIVEDEAIVAKRLARMVRKIVGAGIESLEHAASLDEARARLERESIDLLFLDLNLHGNDGYALLERTVAQSFQTIIVSAHSDQAIRAFELGVTDFVEKPYTEQRLRLAIERASSRERELRDRVRFLAVRRSGAIEMIPVEQVIFIKGAGDYSELHLRSGETRLHDKSLTTLENILPSRFTRVHRSWIVDTDSVTHLRNEPGSRYVLTVERGDEIPVSRAKIRELRSLLGPSV